MRYYPGFLVEELARGPLIIISKRQSWFLVCLIPKTVLFTTGDEKQIGTLLFDGVPRKVFVTTYPVALSHFWNFFTTFA